MRKNLKKIKKIVYFTWRTHFILKDNIKYKIFKNKTRDLKLTMWIIVNLLQNKLKFNIISFIESSCEVTEYDT
jgi:hypothetical protein